MLSRLRALNFGQPRRATPSIGWDASFLATGDPRVCERTNVLLLARSLQDCHQVIVWSSHETPRCSRLPRDLRSVSIWFGLVVTAVQATVRLRGSNQRYRNPTNEQREPYLDSRPRPPPGRSCKLTPPHQPEPEPHTLQVKQMR